MDQPESGIVSIPEGERIVHRSELFDVRIIQKKTQVGMTKDVYLLEVAVEDKDPLLLQQAWVMVEQDIYNQVEKGERVKLRLYEHPNGQWTKMPPVIGGSNG